MSIEFPLGLNGQWIGDYSGTSPGKVIVNIDDVGPCFAGVAYLTPHQNDVPASGVRFRTVNKNREFEFQTQDMWIIDRNTGDPASSEALTHMLPHGAIESKEVTVQGRWDDKHFEASWRTDIGTFGNFNLSRSRAGDASDLVAEPLDWNGFKTWVGQLRGRRHLFRGQNKPWRLRTGYHRRGRADLGRYLGQDIPELHRRLSVRTRHIFDRTKPDENGAFFNLAQHHGYPTPLLDWTYSPFVAAFFAYRGVRKSVAAQASESDRVRVFMLDESWRTTFNQLQILERPFEHFSVAEFIPIENERTVPQQSVSTITNVDDIETYIQSMEVASNRKFLSAIDLPVAARDEVYGELSYMGITAGSLFPGLDGACEELQERNF